jgi:ATP-binding cassette subfamily B protein
MTPILMPEALEACAFPAKDLPELVATLARSSGLEVRAPERPASELNLGHALGLALDEVEAPEPHLKSLLLAGPLVIRLPDGRYLGLLKARRQARILRRDHGVARFALDTLLPFIASEALAAAHTRVSAELGSLPLSPRTEARARRHLIRDYLGDTPIVRATLIGPAPSSGLRETLREAGLGRMLASLVSSLLLHDAFVVLGWTALTLGALDGGLDPGWLLAWGLALLTQLPLRARLLTAMGDLALTGGATIKRWLLLGALRTDIDLARRDGLGKNMSRALESEAFENQALSGLTRLFTATFDLTVSLVLIAIVGAYTSLALAGLALGSTAWMGLGMYRFIAARREAAKRRLLLTDQLVERMVGHRTRLAQEPASRWHEDEDASLTEYLRVAAPADDLSASLYVLPDRALLVFGLVILATSDLSGLDLGLLLAGLLLASQALTSLAGGLESLTDALVARDLLRDQLARASTESRRGGALPPGESTVPMLHLVRASYAYPDRARPALDEVDLTLHKGDRVLLEGRSGSGKSTLLAILSGLRTPSSGLAHLFGLDLGTWGEERWRKKTVAAPQFHDNRILTGTLAMNLLLGRGGLPSTHTAKALEEARTVCDELGLGPLIERMPAGLLQQVGESGWQLSHGEKSRIYLARALLQNADLVLLDESFGPLDPETQALALRCAMARAKTLVVIAHP